MISQEHDLIPEFPFLDKFSVTVGFREEMT